MQQEDAVTRGDPEAMIKVFAETTITRLLTGDGRVAGAFGYYRDTGRFVFFEAPAVVLATGGIGRTFKVTSNSWEYTGDGHALALLAGATLLNMEFVQFHPTHMVWPPSVAGLLVTESVRGDGGVLRNSEGKRFMFNYVPDVFRPMYAETEEEADRWYTDQANNRRPPELLPRDEVARSINAEVKAGRGSPRGGVFLDIASRLPAGEILRKLPSMHHQFLELAGVDITREPMEVGPAQHYMMGGIEVDADTGAALVPGLFAAGEVSGGMHGSNRLGGNSLSDLLVFGRRAGAGAADYLDGPGGTRPTVYGEDLAAARTEALTPLARSGGENPYTVHAEIQQAMSDLVGIIRREERDQGRARRAGQAARARGQRQRGGLHRLQPRLAPRPGPAQHPADRRVRGAGGAGTPGVTRRAHPRRLPADVTGMAQGQPDLLAGRRPGGTAPSARPADPARPAGPVRPGRAEQVHDRRRAGRAAGGEPLTGCKACGHGNRFCGPLRRRCPPHGR